MSKSFLYLPADFNKLPSHEVGSYAKELSKFQNLGIPLTKSAVLPKNTLKIIAQANNLQAKIYKLVQETDYSSSSSKEKTCNEIERLIKKQSIPKELGHELLETYHNFFKNSFVLLKNAEFLPFKDIEEEHIHGDTNFVDAILRIWARISAKKFKQLSLGSTNIHDLLFSTPILIQQQLEPKVSGIAYSYDTNDGSKNRVTVLSTWGVYHSDQDQLDTHLVDIRTKNLISHNQKSKTSQFRRVLGKLTKNDVLEKYKNDKTLSNDQLESLVDLVSAIKKKYLSQVEVLWGIQNNNIFIEGIKESEIKLYKKNKKNPFFKIYSTINGYTNLQKFSKKVDGLAIYNSGKLLSASATHPSQVVKSKQKDYLIEAISRTLIKYANKSGKPLVYRANNFTSSEFNQLQFATLYEVPEKNPYLGFRGGLRFLSQQDAFKMELFAIKNTLEKIETNISLVLPFVRSPEELSKLISIINKQGLFKYHNFEVWLELSTPENILNISAYPIKQIQGVVFNTKSINTLLTGVDPGNQDIAAHYTTNIFMLKQLVENTIKSIKQISKTISIQSQPKMFVDLVDYNKELLEELCDLEIQGLIINEQVTQLAKKCIIERQTNTIL